MNNPTGNSFYLCLKTAFSVPDSMSSTSRETPLSPQRQLSMLALLRTLLSRNNDIQFLIASHSPILLAYPGAQIFSFDEGKIHEVRYQETSPVPNCEPLSGPTGRVFEGAFRRTADRVRQVTSITRAHNPIPLENGLTLFARRSQASYG